MAQLHLPNAKVALLQQDAILQEFSLDGRNIVLSFPTAEPYLTAPYFGETIGRVANRIKGGTIESLNGRTYQLACNQNGDTHLHGGVQGWGHKTFSGPQFMNRHGRDAVQFTHVSPDGEEGYPGTVELRVWYTAYPEDIRGVSHNVLEIEYEVEFVGTECDETVVSVTNHSYFNIGDGPTIEGTEISLATTDHLSVDQQSIPTGDIVPFAGLEVDQPVLLGAKEPAIDHCFVLEADTKSVPLDSRNSPMKRCLSAYHPATTIHLETWSTEPALQFYTGDFTAVAASEHGPARGARSGFCVEPGRFLHAANVPEWRSQVTLKQGQTYGSKMLYRAWKD